MRAEQFEQGGQEPTSVEEAIARGPRAELRTDCVHMRHTRRRHAVGTRKPSDFLVVHGVVFGQDPNLTWMDMNKKPTRVATNKPSMCRLQRTCSGR